LTSRRRADLDELAYELRRQELSWIKATASFVEGAGEAQGRAMAVSMKLETNKERRSMAVFVDGRCVKSGLTEAEANALVSRLLNEQFAAPRL